MLLKPPPNLTLLLNHFNNSSSQQNIDLENVLNSRYLEIDQMQSFKFPQNYKCLSFFHINACSLKENFDDLAYLLKCTKKNFDIIAVSETRISKKISLISNFNLNNYSFEKPPTESTAGGSMLYISNYLSYKPRSDIKIYLKIQLESTFIEIINSKKSNIVVDCAYKPLNMDVLNFDFLVNQLFDKILKEQKQYFFLGDFNINLLNYNEHQPINESPDSLGSSSIIP